MTKGQKDPTCSIFLKRGLFNDIKNDIPMCQSRKYKNTNTQIHTCHLENIVSIQWLIQTPVLSKVLARVQGSLIESKNEQKGGDVIKIHICRPLAGQALPKLSAAAAAERKPIFLYFRNCCSPAWDQQVKRHQDDVPGKFAKSSITCLVPNFMTCLGDETIRKLRDAWIRQNG